MNSAAPMLVAHPWMGSGGSEATAMWTLQALQNAGYQNISFVTVPEMDFDKFNRIYGTTVDGGKITRLRSPRIPGVQNSRRFAHLQNGLFQRHCRRLAKKFELCVSAYNFVDFGKPGLQLIGDYTFSEELRLKLDPDALAQARHRPSWKRRCYLAAGDLLRGDAARPLSARGDLVLANSEWTREIFQRILGEKSDGVLYPPVQFPPPKPSAGRENGSFVCLGRIAPEKCIPRMIHILDRVRAAGFPVRFWIAGAFDTPEYEREIRGMVSTRQDWVELPGFLDAEKKAGILGRTAFGIHARPAEAFGIAVAEMAGAGCIPFVPDAGGPAEIVDRNPELCYGSDDDAVAKIIALLSRPERQDALRTRLAAAMTRFRPESFMTCFLGYLEKFIASGH